MTLRAIKYEEGKLFILDQLKLPLKSEYLEVKNATDGWNAIRSMQVRGAPAIAIVGILSLVLEVKLQKFSSVIEFVDFIKNRLDYLVTSRPTAVNLRNSAQYLNEFCSNFLEKGCVNVAEDVEKFIKECEKMLDDDVAVNMKIGSNGGVAILNDGLAPVNILTHCNTGSLATAGYGTALGVIRYLHSRNQINHVWCTETRPYNQGARLTTYELQYEKIPYTLICDNMVASLMKTQKINAVVVGADCVAANGDTANKIGTYQIAVLAKYHSVPFYVASPLSTINFNISSGSSITIEERPSLEMVQISGVPITSPDVNCWNPAFDVTPAELITGIITEKGVFPPDQLLKLKGQNN